MTITYQGQAIKIIPQSKPHFYHELPTFTLTNSVCYASTSVCRQCKFNSRVECVDNVVRSSNFKEQFPEFFI